ncbi:MAG: hypothetical protein EU542_08810 [Promethearchaeota archaeon]|nr:MAG: hypothetical protein EU542_08810 [Candidatus Lokiarchaeota archaeon]
MTESDIKKIQKQVHALERENAILRQEIESFKKILDNMKKNPLIIGSVERVLEDGRVIVSHSPGSRIL